MGSLSIAQVWEFFKSIVSISVPNTLNNVSLDIAKQFVYFIAFTVKVLIPFSYKAYSPKESPATSVLIILSPS